jgi:hypothetical protein
MRNLSGLTRGHGRDRASTLLRSLTTQVLISPSAVSEARINRKIRRGATRSGALSIERLEGSRPRLRQARALCNLNTVERRCWGRGEPHGIVGNVTKTEERVRARQYCRELEAWRGRKKRFVRRQGGEPPIVPKHAGFPNCGESLHATAEIMRGGERSWI